MRWLRLAAGLVMMLAGVASAAPALAHAVLLATTPAEGAVLAAAPDALALTFNEVVQPTVLRLIGPDGAATDLMPLARAEGPSLVAAGPELAAALAGEGTRLLTWRAVSADGHPVGGTLTFSIGAASGAPVAADSGAEGRDIAIWLCRLLLYAALFFGVGGVFFGRWLVAGALPLPKTLGSLMAAGALSVPLALGLQGMDLAGVTSPAALADIALWRLAARSSYAATLAVAFYACLAGLAALALPHAGRWLALAAFAGIGAALALSGHASQAPQRLVWLAVALHGLAVAFWTGALLPLAAVLRRPGPEAAATLRRFSAAIPLPIAVLLLAGVVLALVQVTTPADLVTTAYGRLLGVKLLLVAALLLLALYNRRRLTPLFRADAGEGGRRLRRAIAAEVALVVAVLAVVAGWRFTPPPRALAQEAPAAAVEAMLMADDVHAMVALEPGRAGPVTLTAELMDGAGEALAPQAVTAEMASPALGIEPIRRAAELRDGRWTAPFYLPAGGAWRLTLQLRLSAFEERTLVGEVELP